MNMRYYHCSIRLQYKINSSGKEMRKDNNIVYCMLICYLWDETWMKDSSGILRWREWLLLTHFLIVIGIWRNSVWLSKHILFFIILQRTIMIRHSRTIACKDWLLQFLFRDVARHAPKLDFTDADVQWGNGWSMSKRLWKITIEKS